MIGIKADHQGCGQCLACDQCEEVEEVEEANIGNLLKHLKLFNVVYGIKIEGLNSLKKKSLRTA